MNLALFGETVQEKQKSPAHAGLYYIILTLFRLGYTQILTERRVWAVGRVTL